MNSKGFYQPIAFIVIVAITITYFALASNVYLDKIDSGHEALKNVFNREKTEHITKLELYDSNGEALQSKSDFTNGLLVKNEGEINVHDVSVYWVDANSGMVCQLERSSNGDRAIKELKRDKNIRVEPAHASQCNGMDTSLDVNDYFLITSRQKTMQRFI